MLIMFLIIVAVVLAIAIQVDLAHHGEMLAAARMPQGRVDLVPVDDGVGDFVVDDAGHGQVLAEDLRDLDAALMALALGRVGLGIVDAE